MLVLSRKLGQSIHVGQDIVVTILEVQGNRVKIGIDAPHDCRILRGELAQWNAAAAETSAAAPPRPVRHTAWVDMSATDAVLASVR